MIEQVKKGYEAVKSGFVTLKNHAITSGKDLSQTFPSNT